MENKCFSEIISVEQLFGAWELFRRGKRQRPDVISFERHLENNIFELHHELKDCRYQHAPYKSFFIHDPKERKIHKAIVRDRIVHQIIYSELSEIYDQHFYYHSYSSRIGKGSIRGVKAAEAALRKASLNNTKQSWALKCDVRRFYDTVSHQVLLRIIKERVGDLKFLELIMNVVDSFTLDANGIGLPIGNILSAV